MTARVSSSRGCESEEDGGDWLEGTGATLRGEREDMMGGGCLLCVVGGCCCNVSITMDGGTPRIHEIIQKYSQREVQG